MPTAKSISSTTALLSNAHRYEITECPRCHSRNMRGPYDTKVNARYLFTRTYCCLTCWWDREIEMKDDALEAQTKHQRAEARRKKQREQARRT